MSRLLIRDTESRAALGQRERSALCAQANAGTREGSGLHPPHVPVGGRLTLEQRLESVWEGLRAGGAPECPVCQAELGPSGGGALGRCGGCGSLLS